jgi:hypothetical protein
VPDEFRELKREFMLFLEPLGELAKPGEVHAVIALGTRPPPLRCAIGAECGWSVRFARTIFLLKPVPLPKNVVRFDSMTDSWQVNYLLDRLVGAGEHSAVLSRES